ncbi:MAG TPA: hypothetical protein VNR38_13290 [Ureibacillus sp.]|nr:hypothetical protein [Ureibacillus sp.]
MKKLLILLFGVGFCLVGCNQEQNKMQEVMAQNENIEVSPIIVYERLNEDFITLKEVIKPSDIKRAINIIENADWEENIKVEMDYPPNYRLKLGTITYGVWVTPNSDHLEIVPEGQSKYVKISDEESNILYEMITGKKLD